MKISTILDQIDLGSIALPEFQRGFVWNRDQVRGLIGFLYRRFPVGSLLVWVTATEGAKARGDGPLQPGFVKLLLDGQQRITSLYGLIKGKSPEFFEGNAQAFTGLYFHIEDEVFEFYAPMKMKDNPLWINVTELMRSGLGPAIDKLRNFTDSSANIAEYIKRLNDLYSIREVDLHIEEVTGEDKNIDVVVEIFNKVNSGGTKLSKGDLALAKVCAGWSDARRQMRSILSKWKGAGFNFHLEWLLRITNSILTGSAYFAALKDVSIDAFKGGLYQTEKNVNYLLNLISARLGLDHDRVLGSRYSFPLLAKYISQKKYQLDFIERDKLLYWYIHTFLWGRYAGSTESVLGQDLNLIKDKSDGLDNLINQLRQNRGSLKVNAADFRGWNVGARFYPMLYMLTRVWKAQDWGSGVELSQNLLGRNNRLHLHHIFPKSKLYKAGYNKAEANAIANFTFLTEETNLLVKDRDPEEYFPQFFGKNPGAVESHWIPMDKSLWKYEKYREFLDSRRGLLAEAANEFLDSLYKGHMPQMQISDAELVSEPKVAHGIMEFEDEERIIQECNEWMKQQRLPEGEYDYELIDNKTGELKTTLDLAWPDGIQRGLSKPVTLLLNEPQDVLDEANSAGFIYYTDIESFKKYVQQDILAIGSSV